MFIEIDVVDFRDITIPFRTVLLNAYGTLQIEPILDVHRRTYAAQRAASIQKKQEDPNTFVSPVEDLPPYGAAIYILGAPLSPLYFTVTPYTEIRALVLQKKPEQNTTT